MRGVRGHVTAVGSVAVLVLLSAAAGGFSASHSPHSATALPVTTVPGTGPVPSICQTPDQLTAMSVTRTGPVAEDQITFTFPDHVVSFDGPAIAAVARTMCRLPVFPVGVFSCPADFGISYLIAFDEGADVVATVTADPSGCPRVTGLGSAAGRLPAFWSDLASALGLPAPRLYCDPFTGRLPDAPAQCGPLLG